METITRSEAKTVGQSWYFTGKPCKHQHVAKRWTLDGTCSACKAAQNRSWWTDNKERGRELAYSWRKANPEKHKATVNKAVSAWQKANPGKRNEITANRRAKIQQATPAWANRDAIKQIYQLC